MRYSFLTDTYETEILKVVSVWRMFGADDLRVRPARDDARGRTLLEHMVHQCMSEDLWFRRMFGIAVADAPLPAMETVDAFAAFYAMAAGLRLEALRGKPDSWWEEETDFFDVRRSRLWIMTRRLNHTAHHRGQQTALLRMLRAAIHSTFGPTADTGGLAVNQAPTIYAYGSLEAAIEGGEKAALPGPGGKAATERP